MKSNNTIILAIILLVPNKKPQWYKDQSIFSISFSFGKGVTIIGWLENMKLYVSYIEESYKDIVIGHLGNSGTSGLLLRIVQSWRTCAVGKVKWVLPMFMYCSFIRISTHGV